jgi:transglutaminase-like putative cysteine protease
MKINSLTNKPHKRRFSFDNISWPVTPPEHSPKRDTTLFIAVLMIAPACIHFFIGSPIVAGFTAAIIALKILALLSKQIRIHQFIIYALALLGVVMVVFIYSGWNTQTAGVSFLIFLLALKFLEAKRLRDYFMTCILLYFVAACSFLYFTGPLDMVLVTAFCCAITAALIKLTSQDDVNWASLLGSSSGILFKALPIAILLFFFFPRINANIGFIPSPNQAKEQNQLSDTLNADEFSESAFSDELAFRVEFEGEIPPNNQLYWRSKVMTIEDNFSWRMTPRPEVSFRSFSPVTAKDLPASEVYRYSILHQPSKDNFIPYLDYPIEQNKGLKLNDYSAAVRELSPINFIYTGASTVNSIPINNKRNFKTKLTEVSRPPSQRINSLLNAWKEQYGSNPKELARVALDYFRNEEFKYSLLPPNLGSQPLDEFLFDSRVGYCSHYASAYTTLMRWLGIPSRVVVGYQGGEFNSAGGYIEVRYSDAHAWSEVWIDNQWQRVDPTAIIRPERIEFGMEALLALLGTQDTRGLSRSALADTMTPRGFDQFLKRMEHSLENFGYQWSKWVVNYDADRQRELLAKIGLNPNNATLFLSAIVIAIITCFSFIYFLMMRPKAPPLSALQKDYLKFIKKLEDKDFKKMASDTPSKFAERAKQKYPSVDAKIDQVMEAYSTLRYSANPSTSHHQLKTLIRQFKLKT